MKNFLILLSFSLLTYFSNAQTWFQQGAVWHYTAFNFFSPVPTIGFNKMEVSGDTLLNGRNCQVLLRNFGCDFLTGNIIVYEDSGRVYFFDPMANGFQLLYDMNLNANDTWTIFPSATTPDSIVFRIDSVPTELFNSTSLKVQYFSQAAPNFNWVFYGKIIERMGCTGSFLPEFAGCDPLSGGLRCYEDSSIGLYETGAADSCEQVVFVSVENLSARLTLGVYPNPGANDVRIILPEQLKGQQLKLEMVDIAGRSITEYLFHEAETLLNISRLQSGIYYLVITSGGRKYSTMLVRSD